MQPDLVSLTLDLTLDEAHDVLTYLHDIRHRPQDVASGSAAEHYGQSVFPTKVDAPAPLTVPVSALVAPGYQPPPAPLAAQPQPIQTPPWQPPQAPLAAQPQPSMPPQWQQQQPVMPIPTAAPTYTLDQLATAAAPLMDAGRGAELSAMLATFGVVSLNQLPADRYPDFALNLRAMGASL